ncbi:MAG: 5-oxoprolinase subunit PxpA [Synoicihabitans sp.]
MKTIDLNCDVGEGVGCEEDLLPLVSSANIACGAHAGDVTTMAHTTALAKRLGVVAGAHPGFADRPNFGRVELRLSPSELAASLTEQLQALANHGTFRYVKPHGALYNMAARDRDIAQVVVKTIKAFDAQLGLLALAGSALWDEGQSAGLLTAGEAFADRKYDANGRLVSRAVTGAVLEDEGEVIEQVLSLARDHRVKSREGKWIKVAADSLCLHGDNQHAVALARRIRAVLAEAGVTVKSPWSLS